LTEQPPPSSEVVIDPTRCQGHGRCYSLFPDLFDCADDDGRGLVIVERPGPAHADHVTRAVRECPERAISWR
jgi:ferredoxin